MNETEMLKLESVVRRIAPTVKPSSDFVWTAAPALQIIDCVLSLNRNYDAMVAPRVRAFATRFPSVQSCADLRALIDSFESPYAFAIDALRYDHLDRANALSGIVDYLRRVQLDYDGDTEALRLRKWAISVSPKDFKCTKVKWFGIAGFQYMRMLFGAETTKPDRRIKDFVRDAIGRDVNEQEAVTMLELVGARTGLSIRWLDFAIWEDASRTKHCCVPPSSP